MSHVSPLPPATVFDLDTLNRMIVEVNRNLTAIGTALDRIQALSERIALIEEDTRGVVVRPIPRVPVVYDPVFVGNVVTTLVDKINTLTEALKTRQLIG